MLDHLGPPFSNQARLLDSVLECQPCFCFSFLKSEHLDSARTRTLVQREEPQCHRLSSDESGNFLDLPLPGATSDGLHLSSSPHPSIFGQNTLWLQPDLLPYLPHHVLQSSASWTIRPSIKETLAIIARHADPRVQRYST